MSLSCFGFRAFSWTIGLGIVTALSAGACSDDEGVMGGSGAGGMSAGAGGGGSGTAGMAGSGTSGSGGGSSGSAGAGGVSGSGGGSGDGGASGGSDVDAVQDAGDDDAGALPFTLSSPAFDNNPGCGPGGAVNACDLFPVENTGLGDGTRNISPELNWVGAPAGTQSFAIAMHDLIYMPDDEPFTHWVVWNIPATETGLAANLPRGNSPGVPSAETGQVSYLADDGFAGSGACGNVYEIILLALSVPSFEPNNTNPDDVEDAIAQSGDVIETATMRARSNPAGPCN